MRDTQITVAIPTYNRAALLKQSLGSVLAQDHPDFQVVVLDNASSDDTEAVVRSFADPRVGYRRNDSNIGMAGNLNRAIEANASPYLNILLDDDRMLPGFLSETARFLDEHPSVGFCMSLARYVDAGGAPLHLAEVDLAEGVTPGHEYLRLNTISRRGGALSSVLMRAAVLAEAGGFDSPHTKHTMDLSLYLRLARHADVGLIRKERVQVGLHPDQASEIEWGPDRLGYAAESIDAIAYLLASPQAAEASLRETLAERLMALNATQSEALYLRVPQLYWSWEERLQWANRDLLALIPPTESFVLVDEQAWSGSLELPDRHPLAFVERDGEYQGPPADDDAAIREVERLRQAGAAFIVFGWPAFWWLDFFAGLAEYLHAEFSCVMRNSRLVAFDLRERS
jgi:glycosyltransferase involved in cell wall biosynthesis